MITPYKKYQKYLLNANLENFQQMAKFGPIWLHLAELKFRMNEAEIDFGEI
jgi:hypothetical protein